MTTVSNLIRSHFGELGAEQTEAVTANAIGYLFRVRSSLDLTSRIREYFPDAKVADFRRDLQTAYFLRNIKLWIWRVIWLKANPSTASSMMSVYEVESRDVPLLVTAMKHPGLHPLLAEMSEQYISHRLEQYDQLLEETLDGLADYIGRFAWKKLRFLEKSGFITLPDIRADLKLNALFALRLQYPKVASRLHLENVAKRAIHNHGMNMISTYTSQSRQHLRQEADGAFTAIKVSIDSAPVGGYLSYHNQSTDLNGSTLLDGSPCSGSSTVIDRLSVQKALGKLKGDRRRFAELLKGQYDADFSAWLQLQGRSDNDELFDQRLARDRVNSYVTLAAQYLGITSDSANSIINEMRASL